MATRTGLPQGPDRRRFFLVGGISLGAAAAAGAGIGEVLAGQHGRAPGDAGGAPPGSGSPSATSVPTVTPVPTRAAGPPRAADWAALRRKLSSRLLVTPESSGYDTAKLLFDPKFDQTRPQGIAYCATASDVSACLDFVRRFGLPVAARSGGHSYGGWSSSTGLVIDVSKMSRVSVDAGAGTARVGAGTLLIDLYSQLAAHGLTVPGGSCPTVGIAGLALGGGVGVVSRLYGLSCDNIVGVQIVTADGVVRDCGAGAEADLFWACRGGGGGSFGVVTEFTFRTHPARDLVLFFLQWPWSAATQVIDAWQNWAPGAPDELWSNLHLSAGPGGGEPSISVGGTYAGEVGAAQALLDRLYSAAGSQPDSAFVRREGFLSCMLVEAGCSSMSVEQCHLPTQNPAGVLSRPPEYAKSDFYTKPLPSKGIATLLDQVTALGQVEGAPGAVGGVAFDAFGGVINRIGAGQTAFVHRDALFLAQYTTGWSAGEQPAGGAGSSGAANQRPGSLRSTPRCGRTRAGRATRTTPTLTWQTGSVPTMVPTTPGFSGSRLRWTRLTYSASLSPLNCLPDPGRLAELPGPALRY
jgi:FAD binding domain